MEGVWGSVKWGTSRQLSDRHNCCRRPVVLLLSPPPWAHQQEKKQPVRILLLLLLPSPPADMFVFMFGLGFNFWLFGIVKILLPALIWKWMLSEKTGAAVEKHCIPFSKATFIPSNLGMQQTKIYLPPPTLGCVFFFFVNLFFKLGRFEHGVKIKLQWQQIQWQLLQQPEKVMWQTKCTIKKKPAVSNKQGGITCWY